jgi:putative transposase
MKYAFIQQHQERFQVHRMCQVFPVSRSGDYEWCRRLESRRSQADRRLGEKIKAIYKKSRRTYGARRIQAELSEAGGEPISRTRVGRLMRQHGLKVKTTWRFRATTDSHHHLPVAENRLKRHFEVEKPDRVTVGDITFIPTAEGWLYLAVLIDLYSRKGVGWALSERMTAEFVDQALRRAIRKRCPPKGLMLHHDRGSQYASALYGQRLTEHGFVLSMSRRGNCWDNAPAESFFRTLKVELTHHRQYRFREEAKQEIFEYIEVFYNRQRRHSSIGYQTPAHYEAQHQKAA